ncbi:MAG: S-layer homology domain-containing protein [Synechocystis sp.]
MMSFKLMRLAVLLPLLITLGKASFTPAQAQPLGIKTPLILASPDLANPFIDIEDTAGKTEIIQLTQLGVITTGSNRFNPGDPIQRDEFIAWLVKSYNALHRTPIPLSSRSIPAFPDVSSSNPYFIYIQSAYDAGLITGFEDGEFKPNDPLTREQMISLKSQLDSKGKDSRNPTQLRRYLQDTRGFNDVAEMGDQYLTYIAFDAGNGAGGRNFERLYGDTRVYAPKAAVTREEAAILVSKFRKGQPIDKVLTTTR